MFCALNYNCSFVYEVFRGFPVKIAFFLSTNIKAKYLIIITGICIMNYLTYIISMVAENSDVKIS